MASMNKSLTREDVTDMIMSVKIQKRIKWADVAPKLKLSKEWVTAACLGQMALTNAQAKLAAKYSVYPPRLSLSWRLYLTKVPCQHRCRQTR